MDWLKLPPLNSLRAFSAVAETGNYTLAARQLSVTHAAVSQQVKILEAHLQVSLVVRSGRSIQLTDEGASLAGDLEIGFAALGRGVERLNQLQAERPVQITMSPAFAAEWLMPKVKDFQQKHPGITLMLSPTADVVELKQGGVDIAVRYRDKRRPDSSIKPLLVSDMIVIGHPSLIGDQDLSNPAALVDLPWLQELGTNEAAEWLTLHGVVPDRPLKVHQMPGNLIMDAVRRGDGITFTARAFFRNDLKSGRVIELFSEQEFGLYYIETLSGPLRPAVRSCLHWLYSNAERVSI